MEAEWVAKSIKRFCKCFSIYERANRSFSAKSIQLLCGTFLVSHSLFQHFSAITQISLWIMNSFNLRALTNEYVPVDFAWKHRLSYTHRDTQYSNSLRHRHQDDTHKTVMKKKNNIDSQYMNVFNRNSTVVLISVFWFHLDLLLVCEKWYFSMEREMGLFIGQFKCYGSVNIVEITQPASYFDLDVNMWYFCCCCSF